MKEYSSKLKFEINYLNKVNKSEQGKREKKERKKKEAPLSILGAS